MFNIYFNVIFACITESDYPGNDGVLELYALAQASGRCINFVNLLDVYPNEAGQWVKDWIYSYNTINDPAQNTAVTGIIKREIAMVVEWGRQNRRPLWVQEFCAHYGADMGSRAAWIEFVRKEFEKYDILWSVWGLKATPAIWIYNRDTGEWIIELTGSLGLSVTNK